MTDLLTHLDTPLWLLLLPILVPFLGAAGIAMLGRLPTVRDGFAFLCSVAGCAAVVRTVLRTEGYQGPTPFFELLPGVAISFHLEPFGVIFALLASGLWTVTALYAIGYARANRLTHQTRFLACFALAIGCAVGIALAENLLTLFLFYELLTLTTLPLVMHSGTDAARRSGRVYLGILMGSSLTLLLAAIVWVWQHAGHGAFNSGGIIDTPWNPISPAAGSLLLLLFIYGFAKAAVMPLHRWLPAAMVAPTPVSALLHAVAVVKAGVFAILKVAVYIFGVLPLAEWSKGPWWRADWLFWAAAATILLASLTALRQDNLKRRLAYSTISQLSYVVLAVSLFTPVGMLAALMHIMAHAFGKITLFFAAGAIYTASGKSRVSELDGIGRRMPLTMGAFAIGALSMIGIPPAAGFMSKFVLVQGAMETAHWPALAVILLSTLLNAAYFLPIVYAAFFKEETVRPPHGHGEAPWLMRLAIAVTAAGTLVLCFGFGRILMWLQGMPV